MKLQELYRQIPKIDRLLETEEMKVLTEKYGYTSVTEAAREAEEEIRREIAKLGDASEEENRSESAEETNQREREAEALQAGSGDMEAAAGLEGMEESVLERNAERISGEIAALSLRIAAILKSMENRRMHPVINATGVILHTNLGRAPLGREVMGQIAPLMTGYTNLEFDLETGKRGSRYDHFSELLCKLTGAEAAMAVNNNAAAVLLMLSALTAGREAVVSRGELIEIGGKFRIPEVMEQSGTYLVEAGTTNRTYVEDYERAVTENTAGFLKVHTSNYKITGFTHEASIEELVELGKKYSIPVLVDLGSGSLVDFRKYGLPGEDTVQEILSKGVDLVTFSGDKLLGGPQAGILAGKKELIEKISRHPLTRALRIDKFTAAALEATLRLYQNEKEMFRKIPVLEMMARSRQALCASAEHLKKLLETQDEDAQGNPFALTEPEFLQEMEFLDFRERRQDFEENRRNFGEELPESAQNPEECQQNMLDKLEDALEKELDSLANPKHMLPAELRILETESMAGGGSMPEERLKSICLSVKPTRISPSELTRRLRLCEPSVVARIEDECVLFDMRTIFPEDIAVLAGVLREALAETP